MAKRGSVEAFKEAEARRQERIKSPKASNMSDARKQKRDAFNAKVKAINESTVNKSSLDRFKKAEADRKARVVSVNKMNPNSPKAKRLLKEQADAKKDLPKSVAPGPMAKDRVASAAAIGAASTAKAAPIASPKKESTATPKKSVDLSGFGEAFKKARAEGVGTKFAYDDKMYSAVTKDDISRSGKSSLQDFLNSTKRTETTIAKAPGQIVKRQSGGEISDERKKIIAEMMKKAKERSERRKGMDLEKMKNFLENRKNQMEARPMPVDPNMQREAKPMPMRPGVRPDAKKYERPIGRPELKERPMRRSGAAVTEGEMQSLMEQMNKPRSMDRFKSGGSVMARGCK
ncbi:MAG TPA: hypothetical protein VMX17_03970, partial [Candidatus Glassbacteria bacterium]|nr:hypothetical protein [Candidatus Glassbacteria bacterium]